MGVIRGSQNVQYDFQPPCLILGLGWIDQLSPSGLHRVKFNASES